MAGAIGFSMAVKVIIEHIRYRFDLALLLVEKAQLGIACLPGSGVIAPAFFPAESDVLRFDQSQRKIPRSCVLEKRTHRCNGKPQDV